MSSFLFVTRDFSRFFVTKNVCFFVQKFCFFVMHAKYSVFALEYFVILFVVSRQKPLFSVISYLMFGKNLIYSISISSMFWKKFSILWGKKFLQKFSSIFWRKNSPFYENFFKKIFFGSNSRATRKIELFISSKICVFI